MSVPYQGKAHLSLVLGGSTWKSKVACKVVVVFCLICSYSYLLTVGDI